MEAIGELPEEKYIGNVFWFMDNKRKNTIKDKVTVYEDNRILVLEAEFKNVHIKGAYKCEESLLGMEGVGADVHPSAILGDAYLKVKEVTGEHYKLKRDWRFLWLKENWKHKKKGKTIGKTDTTILSGSFDEKKYPLIILDGKRAGNNKEDWPWYQEGYKRLMYVEDKRWFRLAFKDLENKIIEHFKPNLDKPKHFYQVIES